MEEKVYVRLSGIAYESLVKTRSKKSTFSQGCKHNCKGCFNQRPLP